MCKMHFTKASEKLVENGCPQLVSHGSRVTSIPSSLQWQLSIRTVLQGDAGAEFCVEVCTQHTRPTSRLPDHCFYGTLVNKSILHDFGEPIPRCPDVPVQSATHMIGPEGSCTAMHIDCEDNGFACIAVLHGEKLVRAVGPEAGKILSETLVEDGTIVQGVTYQKWPDSCSFYNYYIHRFPPSCAKDVMTFKLGPGDALLIPAGWWHQVKNTAPGLTMSTIDLWDLDKVANKAFLERLWLRNE